MTEKIKYSPGDKRRFTELRPLGNGRFQAEWRLTETSLIEPVKITVPPKHAVPIIFVPGIMGSNLCNMENDPVWLLNAVGSAPARLALNWATKKAGYRQKMLHPDRTKVYQHGAVPKGTGGERNDQDDYRKRGWGEVSEASYHKFLLWLEDKIDSDRNPLSWSDFTHASIDAQSTAVNLLTRRLGPGLIMTMPGLPDLAERGHKVDPIKSDELLERSKSIFPIYAFGYNWLASNSTAAENLKARIDKIILENNRGSIKCTQVILVTHSMGGLVARACTLLDGMSKKIVGIVHGVMPATGAAVAYRRCKVGMKDEDRVAGLVIGSDGKEVTAVFAQAPGALQLLPSEEYGTKWLEINDSSGKQIAALPVSDPYEEIYLERERWWGLVNNEWLAPPEGEPISWDKFSKNVRIAREFHRSIQRRYHHNTYVFYGGGAEKGSFSKIQWGIRKGVEPPKASLNRSMAADEIAKLHHSAVRTDGSNNLYVGGATVARSSTRSDATNFSVAETSYWEMRSALQDSAGDGTVPASSGCAPRKGGGKCILQQFELAKIAHEPAYRDYPVAQLVTLYAITKLAAIAERHE
jgi:pimeloyl-ACP methyl ester carboxylesterase